MHSRMGGAGMRLASRSRASASVCSTTSSSSGPGEGMRERVFVFVFVRGRRLLIGRRIVGVLPACVSVCMCLCMCACVCECVCVCARGGLGHACVRRRVPLAGQIQIQMCMREWFVKWFVKCKYAFANGSQVRGHAHAHGAREHAHDQGPAHAPGGPHGDHDRPGACARANEWRFASPQ